MPALVPQPLRVGVFAEDREHDGPLDAERRLMRACALYADNVSMGTLAVEVACINSDRRSILSRRVTRACAERLGGAPASVMLLSGEEEAVSAICGEARAAIDAGVLTTNLWLDPRMVLALDFGHNDAFLAGMNFAAKIAQRPQPQIARRRLVEGQIAVSLLGELEAFPHAPMDVILDVRERLGDSVIHFRAAIAQAASEIDGAARTATELDGAIFDVRRTVVDDALQRIREDLTDLGVRRTLLRLTKDKFAVTSVGATLAMALGTGGGPAVQALLSGAAGAPLIAAAAAEVSARDTLRAEVRTRPYWLLHEAGALLQQRV